MATQTAVARISLGPGNFPATRTSHSIQIRARTTAGAGTIRAALYEGATNRSGDLESGALTNSLADYTLAIPDVNAANITDYSDLELRIWGYAVGGGAIVFEVAKAVVVIPNAAVAKTTTTARISLASGSTPGSRTAHSITVRARKTNALHNATLGVHLFEGASQRTTTELTQALTASLADYTLAISDVNAATIQSYADLELRIRGFSAAGDAAVFEVARIVLNIPAAGVSTAPTAPQSLVATSGNAQVSLGWSASASDGGSAVTAYKIYRSTVSGSETLLASPVGTATSYLDSTAANNTTYYYEVTAVNAIGESGLSNESSATPSVPAQAASTRTFKRLYGPTQLGNAATTLYTCPADTLTVIRHIHVSNPSGGAVTFSLSIGTSAAATKLWDAIPVAASDVLDHYQEHNLVAGEIIQGFAGSAATLNLTVDGYETGGSAPPVDPNIYPSDTLFPSNTSP